MSFSLKPAATLAAAFALGAAAMTSLSASDNPTQNPSSKDTDGVFDYGVCRGVDPECYHDFGNNFSTDGVNRILIFTKTGGFRHGHLGSPLGAGLNPPLAANNVAQAGLVSWAAEVGVEADWTENAAVLANTGNLLNRYDAVVFLSTNSEVLDDAQQIGFMKYIRGGGNFIGIHNAFGTEYHWKWYEGLLGGANFYDHGPHRDGVVETVNTTDVSTADLPDRWNFTDEWYNLLPFPSYVEVLAEVDESTLSTTRGSMGHPGYGDEHPVTWCHYYDGGRAWLTTLGHDNAAWSPEPLEGDEQFKQHIIGGVLSAIGAEPFCQG